MEKHAAEVFYSAVKSVKHAIRTEDEEAQLDAAHLIIQIGKPWTIRRWYKLKLANRKPLVQIQTAIAHLIDLEWAEEAHTKLKTLVERYTSQGVSGVRRVHWWWLACCSLELGDMVDCNDISGQWYVTWPLDSWVDSPMLQCLRETFLRILLNDHMEYPYPDEDHASCETLLLEQKRPENTRPSALPAHWVMQLYPVSLEVHHFEWWLTKYFVDHV